MTQIGATLTAGSQQQRDRFASHGDAEARLKIYIEKVARQEEVVDSDTMQRLIVNLRNAIVAICDAGESTAAGWTK